MAKINISDYKEGHHYTRDQIMESFLVSGQQGMMRSHRTNSLVLVSKHTKPLYRDEWINGVMHYTGMGTVGDQDKYFSQNKTLLESSSSGINVYLFEVFNEKIKKKYLYRGPVILVEEPYQTSQLDVNFDERLVWIFPIKPSKKPIFHEEDILIAEKTQQKNAKKLSDKQIMARLEQKKEKKSSKHIRTVSNTYDRDPLVIEYTKRRAKGKCELCENEAPFRTIHGEPYLEVHHVITLSSSGPDKITNTVALCPNCHRKLHHGFKKTDQKALIRVILDNLLNNEELHVEAKTLFSENLKNI